MLNLYNWSQVKNNYIYFLLVCSKDPYNADNTVEVGLWGIGAIMASCGFSVADNYGFPTATNNFYWVRTSKHVNYRSRALNVKSRLLPNLRISCFALFSLNLHLLSMYQFISFFIIDNFEVVSTMWRQLFIKMIKRTPATQYLLAKHFVVIANFSVIKTLVNQKAIA